MEDKEMLYDHYKDTFEQQKNYLAKRDRLTVFLLVLGVLLIGLIFDPNYLAIKLNKIISSQVDGLVFDFQVLNTGVILVTLWCLLQYYLVVLQIEKMYSYLSECENNLKKIAPMCQINREGAYYLKLYPWLKNVADIFFVIGFPSCFILLAIFKIFNEWTWKNSLRYIDIVALIAITIVSLLYISNRKLKEEYFDKKSYPSLSWWQRLLAYMRFMKIKK